MVQRIIPSEILFCPSFFSSPFSSSQRDMAGLILKNKSMALCLVLVICSFGLCFVSTHAELQRFGQPARTEGTLSFLVLGDWGRKGAFNQSEVAIQMGRIGEKLDIDFVVSTVLGNHDYRGNAEAQLSQQLRKIDSRWLCLRSFIVNAELAEIFFVDTTPFVQSYFTNAEGHTYDWRGIGSPRDYIANLIKDLKLALSESSAKWKIVVGHHAIRSIGHHGDTEELVSKLHPILKANNVDFYMNGHDHCLEHISDTESPIQFLTSGAGSKAWRGDVKEQNKDGLKFFYDGQGFMSVQLTQNEAEIAFYDVSGTVLHRWTTTKLLHSST